MHVVDGLEHAEGARVTAVLLVVVRIIADRDPADGSAIAASQKLGSDPVQIKGVLAG